MSETPSPPVGRRREWASLFEQYAADSLRDLRPDLKIRKRVGSLMLDAYFEQPGFRRMERWGVEFDQAVTLGSGRADQLRGRMETLLRTRQLDRILWVTDTTPPDRESGAILENWAIEHVLLSDLRSMAAGARRWREGGEGVPAADRFVRLDDNRPGVDAAREALEEAAEAVETSNSPEVDIDQRRAIAAEIRTLAQMLQERVMRLVQVQLAVGERGVLAYARGKFKDHLAGAAVSKAFDLLYAAIRSFVDRLLP